MRTDKPCDRAVSGGVRVRRARRQPADVQKESKPTRCTRSKAPMVVTIQNGFGRMQRALTCFCSSSGVDGGPSNRAHRERGT